MLLLIIVGCLSSLTSLLAGDFRKSAACLFLRGWNPTLSCCVGSRRVCPPLSRALVDPLKRTICNAVLLPLVACSSRNVAHIYEERRKYEVGASVVVRLRHRTVCLLTQQTRRSCLRLGREQSAGVASSGSGRLPASLTAVALRAEERAGLNCWVVTGEEIHYAVEPAVRQVFVGLRWARGDIVTELDSCSPYCSHCCQRCGGSP